MTRFLFLIILVSGAFPLLAQDYTMVVVKEAKRGTLVFADPPKQGDTLPGIPIHNTKRSMLGSVIDSAAIIQSDTGMLSVELDSEGKIKFYTFITKYSGLETVLSYDKKFGKPLHIRTDGSEIAVIWQVPSAKGGYYGAILTGTPDKGFTLRVGL